MTRKIKSLERVLRQQAALASFGSYAFRENDLDKILTEAARLCAECLEVPYCKVCRHRPQESDLLIVAGFGWKPDVIGRAVSRADASTPGGRAYITGRPVLASDLRVTHDFELPPFYDQHGIVSTVNVIIKGVGEPYGVLEIDSPEPRDYDGHDVDFLTGFANVLAEAISTNGYVAKLEANLEEKDKLLKEKGILAGELQHRVRNNLQIIQGMMNLETLRTKDPEAKKGFSDIARRIMTLAKVYEHLLGSDMELTVNFGDYLKSLCTGIAEFQKAPEIAVDVVVHAQPVATDLDTVTAIGLAVTELIANSYEHAFADGRGSIEVVLDRVERTGALMLTIRDNGAGFREGPETKRHGLGLVRRLVGQARGTLEVRSDHGTTCIITLPAEPASDRGPDRSDWSNSA